MRALALLALTLCACQPPPTHVRVLMVGDLIPHADVPGDWPTLLGGVAPMLAAADLRLANLEAPVADPAGVHSGLLVFHTPPALLDALGPAGFDAVNLANNHIYDQGRPGLAATLDALARRALPALGAGRTAAEAQAPRIFERRGLRLCVLGFTRRLNDRGAQPAEPDAPQVTYVPYGPRETKPRAALLERVRAARPGCEVLAVTVHWGDEYHLAPRSEDAALAAELVDAGADLVLGHHPHVVQPLAERTAPDGRRAIIAYSLGNFVSHQRRQYPVDGQVGDTRDGLAVEVTFVVTPTGVRLEQAQAIPLLTAWDEQPVVARRFADRPDLAAREEHVAAIVGPRWISETGGQPAQHDGR